MTDIVERLRKDAEGWAVARNTVTGPFIASLERDAADEIERLRKGIQDYLDDDYEPKVKKIEKCHHGVYGYEACENCIDEHFAKLLANAPKV